MAGQVLGARELKRRARMEELLTLERGYWARGLSVAGMDEVGRGPLAGPVVAACVMLSPDGVLPGVDDSKKLSESRREQLAPLIRAAAQLDVYKRQLCGLRSGARLYRREQHDSV